MKIKWILPILIIGGLITSGFFAGNAGKLPAVEIDGYVIDTLATGLTVPWAIVFLPDNTMLFSERSGKVGLYRENKLLPKPALVVTDVEAKGKMGLLGMCIHPQFRRNNFVYLSYTYRKDDAALLKIVRFRFVNDSLIDPVVILDDIRASRNHTGCRLVFGPDGKLYITTGDADRPVLAQDLKSLSGKILRVKEDGSIPADNPFVHNDTARKEIWTYGHRNAQGIAFEPRSGQLFNSEHGPSGGDEINLIRKGQNYGWPLIHHKEEREGMETPLLEYSPSIGPSEMVFYTANAFSALKGKMLVACLRGEKILQLQWNATNIVSEKEFLQNRYGQIRALTAGPDGFLYFSTSQNDPPEGKFGQWYDMILRMRPSSTENSGSSKTVVREKVKTKEPAVKKTPAVIYDQLCASCHGKNLEGTDRGQSLADKQWLYGSKRGQIVRSISEGIIEKGMPAWEGALSKREMENLADFILAQAKKKR